MNPTAGGAKPKAATPAVSGNARLWLAAGILITFLASVNSVEAYTANRSSGYALPWTRALLWGAITWYLWLPLIPLLLYFNSWLHRTRAGGIGRLLLSGLTSVLVAGAILS